MSCMIADIDASTTERLSKLRRIAERFGAPPRNPHGHITLATYIGYDEDGFIVSCKTLLSGYKKFSVSYDKVMIFDATAGGSTYCHAKRYYHVWAADLNQWTQEDTWSPYTSLLYSRQLDLPAILKAMQEEYTPFTAQVDRIEFTQIHEDASCEQVDFLALQ